MVQNGYGTKMIFTMVRNDYNSNRLMIFPLKYQSI